MLHIARCIVFLVTYQSVTYWICRSKCITSIGAAIDGMPLGIASVSRFKCANDNRFSVEHTSTCCTGFQQVSHKRITGRIQLH